MTHKIDRRWGVMGQIDPSMVRSGWERDLMLLRRCVQCGRFIHPRLWEDPCAWTRPEYRLERQGLLALGRLK